MVRADKRKHEKPKKAKTPTYNFTQQQIEAIKEKAANEAVARAVILMIAFPLKVLERDQGWQQEHLEWLGTAIVDEYNKFADENIDIIEYANYVYETAGLRMELEQPNTKNCKEERQ